MPRLKVFISSVQNEFAKERKTVAEFLRADVLLGKFFDPFIFEELPAYNSNAQELYTEEVVKCNIYLGIIGLRYGSTSSNGLSPTENEYNAASLHHKTRLLFLTSHEIHERDEAVQNFIIRLESEVIRNRFTELSGLLQNVYHSLVRYLEDNGYIQLGPFDTQTNSWAKIDDIDDYKVRSFVQLAKQRRGFPLSESRPILEILYHLHLIRDDKITNAALLLFGKEPKKFFPSAVIKCAIFHGYSKTKPIPSFKIFDGDVFEVLDLSIEFIMSKLDFSIGVRANSNIAPGTYEIPREVIAEGIVNAIAHRDYSSNASVEVLLFKDRLEIINPGSLPLGWTTNMLKQLHNSVPHNPLLAHPMYLAGYIEQLGTGTEDMLNRLKNVGLPEPHFLQEQHFKTTIFRSIKKEIKTSTGEATGEANQVQVVDNEFINFDLEKITGEVTGEVRRVVLVMQGEMRRQDIQSILEIKHDDYFRTEYISPALSSGLIEMTYPEIPNHPRQRYRLTTKGTELQRIWKLGM